MKKFIKYFSQNFKIFMPISIIVAIFLSVMGLAYHSNNSDLFRYILLFLLFGIFTPIIMSVFKSMDMILKDGNEFPFDNRIIGTTFSSLSAKSRYFHKGVDLLHKGDFNSALDIFSELEEIDMKDSWKAVLYYFHGRTYQLMGYPTNAAKYYVKSVENNINIDDIYIMIGRCFTYTGCYNEAIEYYEKLLEKETRIDYVLTDMGLTYLKAEMADEALDCFQKSMSQGKNYAFALGGCSLAYLQKKDLEQSRSYYSRALINNMDDVDGFKGYYCRIAEAGGMLDKIDENMKKPDRSLDNDDIDDDYDIE